MAGGTIEATSPLDYAIIAAKVSVLSVYESYFPTEFYFSHSFSSRDSAPFCRVAPDCVGLHFVVSL